MECNKDEALRAKLIAESKLETKDFAGAKKFALKAKTLYPYLDGITQLMTTIDVCICGENKIGGLANWYGMLGVKPSDDDETIRKQYRKLALLLHPDKNKSAGADGAFKLISEAWRVLSDKGKRAVYDQCRVSKGSQSKVQMHASGPSAPPPGIFDFTGKATSVPKTQKKSPNAAVPPTPPSNRRTDSFWTLCHGCKMHYEYQRQYLNQNLLCPTCRDVFHATETEPPYYFSGSSNPVPRQKLQTSSDRTHKQDAPVSQKSGSGQASSNSFRYRHHHQGRHFGTTGIGTANPSVAEKASNGMEQVHGTLKRVSTVSPTSLESEGSLKKRKVDNGTAVGIDNHIARGNGGNGTASGIAPGPRIPGFSGAFRSSNSMRDLTPAETRNLLIMKARKDILNKLSTMLSESTEKARKKEENKTKKSNCEGSIANAKEHNRNGYNDSPSAKVTKQPGKDQSNHSARDASEEEETPTAATMSVPDPEFHDFDKDRSESSFGDNEVWAAYDDDDGMPRFYALINKVISRKPFKLRISWLNSKSNSEFSTIDWVSSGFYKTCGEFRVGKYETCKFINSFSHKVNWSKGPRGAVLLFPKKGDVWALYRNWSPDWDEHTPDEVMHKYDMVLVLDEYNEERGISVAPLVKVAGFKAIFRPNIDGEAMKKIPRAEMFRFSHQVPYFLLTGQEAENAPKGFLELDPAATPLELLQVMTESNGISMDSNKLTAAEGDLQSISMVDAVDVTGNSDSAVP